MLKRLVAFAFLIIILAGLIGAWAVYRHYRAERAERIARLQEQAAETQVTIIEGWSNAEIAAYLEKQGLFSKDDFLTAIKKFDTSEYPLIKLPSDTPTGAQSKLEGYLFPDTYRFAKDATPEDVIDKMLANFSNRVKSLNVNATTKYNDLTLYQIITLASIIEKESGGQGSGSGDLSLQDERDLVAGVFYNRLEIGQALESDATVNYVTGKDSPAASASDIQVTSAYNTYRNPGLPPGPICNPSLGSIKAALKPAQSDYLYFLHKQPSGKVIFSKTFEEHKRAKAEN